MAAPEIKKGLWKHNKESLSYRVLGNASMIKNPADMVGREATLVGTALFVEGYEESGVVKGWPVQVFEDSETGEPRLRFLKTGQFPAPDTIVVYRQLQDGKKYKANQLWWRSAENFAVNFTPLDL